MNALHPTLKKVKTDGVRLSISKIESESQSSPLKFFGEVMILESGSVFLRVW